jgi:hypothetical protein
MPDPLFDNTFGEEIYLTPAPVTVIIGSPWTALGEDHVLLLSKILIAIGKSLEGVRIVQQEAFDMSAWNEKPERVLAFVPPPKGILPYDLVRAGEGALIFSDPLEILQTNDIAKRKLWDALKTLFQS